MMKPFTATNPYHCIQDSCGITLCVDSGYGLYFPSPWAMKVTRLTPSVTKTVQNIRLSSHGYAANSQRSAFTHF